MNFVRRGLAALGLIVATTIPAVAQPIVVVVRYGAQCGYATFQSGAPIEIVLDPDPSEAGLEPLTSTATVRIYDSSRDTNGLPVNSVGSVTIRGVAGEGGRLDVMVLWKADPPLGTPCDTEPGFPTLSAPRLPAGTLGVVDFPSLTILGPVGTTDDTLRAKTRLVVGASGRIGGSDGSAGTISVGQVFRVQAGDPLSPTAAGVISADITATGANESVVLGEPSIGAIAAGDLISGKITAGNTALTGEFPDVANIGRIVVGPSVDARGIRGNIAADKGSINSILTTGPIGRLGTPTLAEIKPSITARNGILEILATDPDATTPGIILAKTFVADVRTVPVTAVPDADNNPGDGGGVEVKATIGIKTAGDYHGSITVQNLKNDSSLGLGETQGPSGIIVGGTMHGPITVVDGVWRASIAAATFEAPIVINTTLNGAVVATSATGHIPTLKIGTDIGRAVETCHGFRDTRRAPAINRADAFKAGGLTVDGQPTDWPDSLVAGNSIGTLEISRMWIGKGANRPRIETPSIHVLRIGNLREGVVWSGIDAPVEPPAEPNGRQLSPNPYVQIGTAVAAGVCEIGETARTGDLFLRLVNPAGIIEIGGQVLGSNAGTGIVGHLSGPLVMPELAVGQVVRVRGHLTFRPPSPQPGCAVEGKVVVSPDLFGMTGAVGGELDGFATPRNARFLLDQIGTTGLIGVGGSGAGGAIRLMGQGTIAGQIVLNSSAVSDGTSEPREKARGWFGSVAIRDKQPLRIITNPQTFTYLDTPDRLILAPVDTRQSSGNIPPLWNPGAWASTLEEPPVTIYPGGPTGYEGGAYWPQSTDLGGGAVGAVPYRIHREDSEPKYAYVPPTALPDTRLRDARSTPARAFTMTLCNPFIRFYGPVYDSNPSGPGEVLRVLHAGSQADLSGPSATDVTSHFTITMGSTVLTNPEARRVYLQRQSTAPLIGWFRVQPNLDRLKCGLATTAQPTPVADDTLDFFVAGCNPADIAQTDGTPGGDGFVDNGDFQLFFFDFFNATCLSSCPQPPVDTPQCNSADIARADGTPGFDGCVNNGDFQLFFTSFFSANCTLEWCPPPVPQGDGEGEGMMSSMARAASVAGLDQAVVEQRLNALRNLGRPITPEDVRAAFPELLPGGSGGGGSGGSDQ